MRKEMGSGNNTPNALHKSHSCSSIKDHENGKSQNNHTFKFDNSLTVHVRNNYSWHCAIYNQISILQSSSSIPIITMESVDDFKPYSNGGSGGMTNANSQASVTIECPLEKEPPKITWTTMTPQQISIWIDK